MSLLQSLKAMLPRDQVDQKPFSSLLNYEALIPDLLKDPKHLKRRALIRYSNLIESESKENREYLQKCALNYFFCLPTEIDLKDAKPPQKKQKVQPYQTSFRTSTNPFRSSEIYNLFNYVGIKDMNQKLPNSWFDDGIEYLNAKGREFNEYKKTAELSEDESFAPSYIFPISRKGKEIANERDIEGVSAVNVVDPVLSMLEISCNMDLNNADHREYKLWDQKGAPHGIAADFTIRHESIPLVVVEVKQPSIGFWLKEDDHRFTEAMTQISYEALAAGTPFGVVTDYEVWFFFEIVWEDLERFEYCVNDCGDSQMPKVEDLRIGLPIRYRQIQMRDSVYTVTTGLAATIAQAYQVLIERGLSGSISRVLRDASLKCLVTEDHFRRREEKDKAALKREADKLFFPDLLSKLTIDNNQCQPVSVTNEAGQKNSQVFKIPSKLVKDAHVASSTAILKVYDPTKCPDNFEDTVIPYNSRLEVTLAGMKSEIDAYKQLDGLKCCPHFYQMGFIDVASTEPALASIYGPYLMIEEIKGVEPDMTSEYEVELILRSYAQLLERGVIHGDIKASNILIVDNPKRAIMLDFGVSHIIDVSRNAQDNVTLYQEFQHPTWEKDFEDAIRELSPSARKTLGEKYGGMFSKIICSLPTKEVQN